jgi:hypothetical protein
MGIVGPEAMALGGSRRGVEAGSDILTLDGWWPGDKISTPRAPEKPHSPANRSEAVTPVTHRGIDVLSIGLARRGPTAL